MVSQGSPSRSMVAIEFPSSTASAFPTPWKRSAQPIASVPPGPAGVIGLAQAGEIRAHLLHGALAPQLEQGAFQPREVAGAPAGFRQPLAAAVQVDHPALTVGVEQDVVGVEVDVVESAAVAAGDQLAGLLPGRAVPGGQLGQAVDVAQPLDEDGRAIERAPAQVAGRNRFGHREPVTAQFAQQAELEETACPVGAAPQVKVAAQPGGKAPAQVMAQHRVAERALDEPGAPAPSAADRLRVDTPGS